MNFRNKRAGRSGTGTTIVLAVLGLGLAYAMATQAPSVLSTAAAATIPDDIARSIGADPDAPGAGNPIGAVTVAEFFDYRCPYCRTMQPTLDALVAKDRRVRVVFKEWPIFGGASVTAARVALAARWQGKYAAVHEAFFKLPRTMDEAAIRQAAANSGVDMARLDRDLATRAKEIDAELATVDGEARALGFQGTPSFVIGSLLAPGAIPPAELSRLVDRAAQTPPSR